MLTRILALCIYTARALVIINNESALEDCVSSFNVLQTDTDTLKDSILSYTSDQSQALGDQMTKVMRDASSLSNVLIQASFDGVNGTVSDIVASKGLEYYSLYGTLVSAAQAKQAQFTSSSTLMQNFASLNAMVATLLVNAQNVGPNSYAAEYFAANSQLTGLSSQAANLLHFLSASTHSLVKRPRVSTFSMKKSTSVMITTTQPTTVISTTSTSTSHTMSRASAVTAAAASQAVKIVSSTSTPTTSTPSNTFQLRAIMTGSIYSDADPSYTQQIDLSLSGEEVSFSGDPLIVTILNNGSLTDGTRLLYTDTHTQGNYHPLTPAAYVNGVPQYSSSDHSGQCLVLAELPTLTPDVSSQIWSLQDGKVTLSVGGMTTDFFRCYARDGSYLYAVPSLLKSSHYDSCYPLTLIANT